MNKCLVFIFLIIQSVHGQYFGDNLFDEYLEGREEYNYSELINNWRDGNYGGLRDIQLEDIQLVKDYPSLGFDGTFPYFPDEPVPICPPVPIPWNPDIPFIDKPILKITAPVIGKCIDGERIVVLTCNLDQCPKKNTVKIPCGYNDAMTVRFRFTNTSVMKLNHHKILVKLLLFDQEKTLRKYIDLTPNIFKLVDNVGKRKVQTSLKDFKKYIDLECKGRNFNQELLSEEENKQLRLVKKFCDFAGKIDHFEDYQDVMDTLMEKLGGDISLLDIRALHTLYTPSNDSDLELQKQQALQLLAVRWLYMNIMMQNTAAEIYPLFETWYRGTGLWYGMTSTPMMRSYFNSNEYNSKVMNFAEAMKCPKKNKVCLMYRDLISLSLREVVKDVSSQNQYDLDLRTPIAWDIESPENDLLISFRNSLNNDDNYKGTIAEVESILKTGKCHSLYCKPNKQAIHSINEIEKLDSLYKQLNFLEADEVYKEILKEEGAFSFEKIEELVNGLEIIEPQKNSLEKAKKSWLMVTDAKRFLDNKSLMSNLFFLLSHFPKVGSTIVHECQKIEDEMGKENLEKNFTTYCSNEMSLAYVDLLWKKAEEKHKGIRNFKNTFKNNLYKHVQTVRKEILK